jgi:hypothetical protein
MTNDLDHLAITSDLPIHQSYTDGVRHRTNGPAVVYSANRFVWFLNDQCHRYYGPANHLRNWFFHGEFIHKEPTL